MQKLHRSRGIFSITIALTILLLLSIPSQSHATNKDTERLQQIQEKSSIENPPEDLVGIPQYKISTTKSYGIETFDIDGQIQNRGEDELVGTQIIATFFDEGGQFLGSEYGSISVDPMPPGETVSFKINLMSGVTTVPIDDIASIKFRISSVDLSESSSQSSSVTTSSSSSLNFTEEIP